MNKFLNIIGVSLITLSVAQSSAIKEIPNVYTPELEEYFRTAHTAVYKPKDGYMETTPEFSHIKSLDDFEPSKNPNLYRMTKGNRSLVLFVAEPFPLQLAHPLFMTYLQKADAYFAFENLFAYPLKETAQPLQFSEIEQRVIMQKFSLFFRMLNPNVDPLKLSAEDLFYVISEYEDYVCNSGEIQMLAHKFQKKILVPANGPSRWEEHREDYLEDLVDEIKEKEVELSSSHDTYLTEYLQTEIEQLKNRRTLLENNQKEEYLEFSLRLILNDPSEMDSQEPVFGEHTAQSIQLFFEDHKTYDAFNPNDDESEDETITPEKIQFVRDIFESLPNNTFLTVGEVVHDLMEHFPDYKFTKIEK